MNLLMISGDRSLLQGKKSAFWYTLEEMSKHWDRIDVICPHVKRCKKMPHTFFENVHFHPGPAGIWRQPRWIVKKGKELVVEHLHSVMSVHEYPPFYNGFGAEWLSRKTGVPYVLEVHHIVGYPVASSFTELIGRWMSHLFLVNDSYGASAVRTVGSETANVLERWGAESKQIHVVPSFYLDREVFKPRPNTQKKFDLVVSGRLVANKGIEEVMKAVSLLKGVSILVVGDGPKKRQLKRLTKRLNIARRVHFAGWLTANTDVCRALSSAKVYVMNSRSEGGPRVALEAMALGLPVISTRVGVMPDVIEDAYNGFFTTGHPRDLAEKIEKLLKYPALRERLGLEAQKIVQKFERKKLIREYANFLKSYAKRFDASKPFSTSSSQRK